MTEVMNQQGGGLDSTLSQPHFSPPTSPPSQAQADAAAGAKSASPPPEATQREGTIVQPLTRRMKTKQSTLGAPPPRPPRPPAARAPAAHTPYPAQYPASHLTLPRGC